MKALRWLRVWSGEKPDLGPEELEELILNHVSEKSLTRYQERMGAEVSGQIADWMDSQVSGYARAAEQAPGYDSGAADVLKESADLIRKSTFPSEVVVFRRKRRD